MLGNEAKSVEEVLKNKEQHDVVLEEELQEDKSIAYNIIDKGMLGFKYSMDGMSYLLSGASYATYFASYVPYSVSYLLTKENCNHKKSAVDKGFLGVKYIMDGATQVLVGTSSVLDSASYIPHNVSSIINKENRDYVASQGSFYAQKSAAYINSQIDFVASSFKGCNVQSIVPTTSMVV